MKTVMKRMGMVAAVLTMAAVGVVRGQTFSSGSTGVDGALTLTTPGTVIFNPVALGIDVDGDNVFNFTTITIGPDVIVELRNNPLRGRSVVWLATGAVDISGTIRLNGQDGHPATAVPGAQRYTSEPGPGGYSGGMGGLLDTTAPQPGNGPGGGLINFGNLGNGGGAVHAVSNPFGTQFAYDNSTLVPLRGGSGGAGGGAFPTAGITGGGGGAGGGAVRIASSTSISVSGGIEANGGLGGARVDSFDGGGGSGGAIHLV